MAEISNKQKIDAILELAKGLDLGSLAGLSTYFTHCYDEKEYERYGTENTHEAMVEKARSGRIEAYNFLTNICKD